ncbi:CAP domain-containing protein [Aquimarina rhabdastrellae]
MRPPIIKFLFFIVLSANLIACSKDDDSTNTGSTDDTQQVDDNEQVGENGYKQIVLEIHRLVNEHRTSINLNTLELNEVASELSVDHCEYMIQQGTISHDNFGTRSDELNQRVGAVSTGENVAAFQRSAEQVMNDWLNSPGHRRNIEGNFTHIGIAAEKDADGRYYFTQFFYR